MTVSWLSVATDDRSMEFLAYDIDYQSRGARFRNSLIYLCATIKRCFSTTLSSLGKEGH